MKILVEKDKKIEFFFQILRLTLETSVINHKSVTKIWEIFMTPSPKNF